MSDFNEYKHQISREAEINRYTNIPEEKIKIDNRTVPVRNSIMR